MIIGLRPYGNVLKSISKLGFVIFLDEAAERCYTQQMS